MSKKPIRRSGQEALIQNLMSEHGWTRDQAQEFLDLHQTDEDYAVTDIWAPATKKDAEEIVRRLPKN